MFNKVSRFTLIELIVVIVVVGILSSIVIPNISNMNRKAQVTAINANIRNVQTAVDSYFIENRKYPLIEQPTIQNPQKINFELLHPKYLKSIPNIVGEDYWIDSLGIVWASNADTVEIKGIGTEEVSWKTTPDTTSYKVFEVVEKGIHREVKELSLYNLKTNLFREKSRKDLTEIIVDETIQLIKFESDSSKEYLVSSADELGFYTAPIGVDFNTDTDVSIPKDQLTRTLYINTYTYDTSDWLSTSKRETLYDGTSISYQYAYSNDEGKTWSEWHDNIEDVPNSKALRVKVSLTRIEGNPSPILHFLKVNYSVEGKVSECAINLHKPQEYCQEVIPTYPEISIRPDIPIIVLPTGGSSSQEINIPSLGLGTGNIITGIIPDYEISGPNGSNNSNSAPNISYEVSYDGGNTWNGIYSNIIDIPNKEQIDNIKINYEFEDGITVTIKPPFINSTDSSNKIEVEESIEITDVENTTKPEEQNWLIAEEFELIENSSDIVEWLSVYVKQDKANSELGKLEVYLSISNDGDVWSEEILGVDNVAMLEDSSHLKVKIQSKYLESSTLENAPLLEEINIKSKKSNGELESSNYVPHENGSMVDTTPNIKLYNNVYDITSSDYIEWAYKNENPNVEIVEEKWILNSTETATPPNGILAAGDYNLILSIKQRVKGTTVDNLDWVEVINIDFSVSESQIKGDWSLYTGHEISYALNTKSRELFSFGHGSSNLKKVSIPSASPIKQFSHSYSHGVILLEDGSVYSLGTNMSGELGIGNTTATTGIHKVKDLPNNTISIVEVGVRTSFAVTETGEVYAWGNNSMGQLGLDSKESSFNTPTKLSLSNVVDITAGFSYTFFETQNKNFLSCGSKSWGATGQGVLNEDLRIPKEFKISGEEIDKIYGSFDFVIAKTKNNNFYGWGYGNDGTFGIPNVTSLAYPTKIPFLSNSSASIKDVFPVGMNTHAIMTNGDVYSTGQNIDFTLGIGQPNSVTSFIKNNELSSKNFITFIGSSYHSLGITEDGVVYGWGNNLNGQLGINNFIKYSIPTQIDSLSNHNKGVMDFNKSSVGKTVQ